MTTSVAERFWAKVDKSGECWVWTASTAGPGAYGHCHVSGGMKSRVRVYAHRWSYEQVYGPIPDGLTIDHLCRNRLCVRPDHLEAVTFAVNHERRRGIKTGPYNVGTHCRHGHERTPENTRFNSLGARASAPLATALPSPECVGGRKPNPSRGPRGATYHRKGVVPCPTTT
jgi:hypothetical protein